MEPSPEPTGRATYTRAGEGTRRCSDNQTRAKKVMLHKLNTCHRGVISAFVFLLSLASLSRCAAWSVDVVHWRGKRLESKWRDIRMSTDRASLAYRIQVPEDQVASSRRAASLRHLSRLRTLAKNTPSQQTFASDRSNSAPRKNNRGSVAEWRSRRSSSVKEASLLEPLAFFVTPLQFDSDGVNLPDEYWKLLPEVPPNAPPVSDAHTLHHGSSKSPVWLDDLVLKVAGVPNLTEGADNVLPHQLWHPDA